MSKKIISQVLLEVAEAIHYREMIERFWG